MLHRIFLFLFISLNLVNCQMEKPYKAEIPATFFFTLDSNDEGLKSKWFQNSPANSALKPFSTNLKDLKEKGAGWYFTQFQIPPLPDPRLVLVFEAIDGKAEIWVNGRYVGHDKGEMKKFALNISSGAHQGLNNLTLRISKGEKPGTIPGKIYLERYDEKIHQLKGPLHKSIARQSEPWVKDAVIYEVFVRSFSPEGTFKGVEKQLPRLKKLGVSVVWLMPVHPVGYKNHKGLLGSPYAVRDFYAVNPHFGTMQDFKDLVKATHDLGMRIIIDIVANHTAWDGPMFEEHPEWYTKNKKGEITHPVGTDWTDVADLNYDVPELRKYMADMLAWWIREIDLDGFRCDVAEMVPLDFWETVRSELDLIKPIIMLAEGAAPELQMHAFDMTYSWSVYHAGRHVFEQDFPADHLVFAENSERNKFPQNSAILHFSSNHDENAWQSPSPEMYGEQGMKAAAVLSFTFPGVPLIYNGQEVSNPKTLKLFEAIKIDWSQDTQNMTELYSQLAQVRRQFAAFTQGQINYVATGAESEIIAFYRILDAQKLLVVVNVKNVAASFSLPVKSENINPLVGDLKMNEDSFQLPAFGYFIGEVQ
ncbi:MAG: hypothetical protein DWQ05_20865 [Calditrichaeota bacterium]|nr:MAG: hypothetical protein DWQ05_20865 [Calditrichota bacterium]